MKRCAILFAILIVSLIIAVWAENRQGAIDMDEVALEDINSLKPSGSSRLLSE